MTGRARYDTAEIIDACMDWIGKLSASGQFHSYRYRDCCDHYYTGPRDARINPDDARLDALANATEMQSTEPVQFRDRLRLLNEERSLANALTRHGKQHSCLQS